MPMHWEVPVDWNEQGLGSDEGLSEEIQEEIRSRARAQYGEEGRVEIDADARLSLGGDPGCYVQAWVWVYREDCPKWKRATDDKG